MEKKDIQRETIAGWSVRCNHIQLMYAWEVLGMQRKRKGQRKLLIGEGGVRIGGKHAKT